MASLRSGAAGKVEIAKLGIGITMRRGDEWLVVSDQRPKELVSELGFISKMVLGANIDALENIRIVAKTSEAVLIQAPTLMHESGKSRMKEVRYLFAIDSASKLRVFVWIADPALLPRSEWTAREIMPGLREERRFFVDGSAFNFGLPSRKAFGLMDLPPGIEFNIPKEGPKLGFSDAISADDLSIFVMNVLQMRSHH